MQEWTNNPNQSSIFLVNSETLSPFLYFHMIWTNSKGRCHYAYPIHIFFCCPRNKLKKKKERRALVKLSWKKYSRRVMNFNQLMLRHTSMKGKAGRAAGGGWVVRPRTCWLGWIIDFNKNSFHSSTFYIINSHDLLDNCHFFYNGTWLSPSSTLNILFAVVWSGFFSSHFYW